LRLSNTAQTKPAQKPKRERQPAQKNDPKHVAPARELRDRHIPPPSHGIIDFNIGIQGPPFFAAGMLLTRGNPAVGFVRFRAPAASVS
jgi:hypothetical protein